MCYVVYPPRMKQKQIPRTLESLGWTTVRIGQTNYEWLARQVKRKGQSFDEILTDIRTTWERKK